MIEEWTILYHTDGMKGRAEFLRLMLEDAQISFVVSNEKLYGANGIMVRIVINASCDSLPLFSPKSANEITLRFVVSFHS